MDASLYLVATPIGNLDDISIRALRVLKEVDLIAAEDTRHTRKLLSHYNIHTPLTSYFEHNKRVKGEYIVSQLKQGKSVALVSDAGMPGISDPGEDLVREVIAQGLKVCPIPGPSASIAALVVSGLPTDRFIFEGFLPREKKDKRQRMNCLKAEQRTIILYESPYRLIDTLMEFLQVLGDRKAAVSREITKKYEETIRGTLSEMISYFQDNPPKGEITLVIAGREEQKEVLIDTVQLKGEIKKLVNTGMAKKDAVKEIAMRYGLPKNQVYRLSLEE
ncbi:MAG: 16S rRNA (cytidine(1402)-2'-O)-methyltransferase [Bacillota bacterium]|jgi:16S rRNA (cytidine1402-2'-O)-methyltransferase